MCPNTRNQFSIERRRPRMLKDYLLEDLNSFSSSGFKSFPRKPALSDSAARRRAPIDVSSSPRKLLRSPSKAALTTISAFRAMINAVKNIQFVKSQSIILPRSLSRSLSRRSSAKNKNPEQNLNVRQVKITVKDIMRWTSFRDINVEQHSDKLFDSASTSDHHWTATTTTATSSCTCSSSGSSWCDSDFTAEDLLSWSGNCEEDDGENKNDVVDKKNLLPAIHKEYCEDVTAGYTVEPKVEAQCEEERHEQSPITVLHHEFEEDEESLSSLDQSLVNFEMTKEKHMQNIRRLESLANEEEEEEERYSNLIEDQQEEFIRDEENEENIAWQLLEQVKTTSSLDTVEQLVLFDFFRDKLGGKTKGQIRHPGLETEMVIRKAIAWVRGEHSTLFELGVDGDEDKRKAFVNDLYMEGRGRWSGEFEEEQNELAMEVENDLLCDLVDQLLFDILL